MNKFIKILSSALLVTVLLVSCKKDYFKDTGKHTADYNGTVMDYINARPDYFTLLSGVIKLAGMENILRNEDVTFFAPSDSSIRASINFTNSFLLGRGMNPVTKLSDIKPQVWRKYLARYVFKGKKQMNDYPQLDLFNLSAYPGQIYASYDGLLMNIGVIYNSAGDVQYAGYRMLMLSYIPSAASPLDYRTWWYSGVASSNIKATNGYVHALGIQLDYFGFSFIDFMNDVTLDGTTNN